MLGFRKGNDIVLQAEQERLEMAAEQERRAEEERRAEQEVEEGKEGRCYISCTSDCNQRSLTSFASNYYSHWVTTTPVISFCSSNIKIKSESYFHLKYLVVIFYTSNNALL